MTKKILAFLGLLTIITVLTKDLTTVYEISEASHIIKNNFIDIPTKFTMPNNCKLADLERIERGKSLNHKLTVTILLENIEGT